VLVVVVLETRLSRAPAAGAAATVHASRWFGGVVLVVVASCWVRSLPVNTH
jgi:hypothetical protein